MGRLTKAKIDEIGKLRKQGYTQKETAEKVRVNLRSVRKYDPLRDKRIGPTAGQLEFLEACRGLVAMGLAEESDEKFRISLLGKRVSTRLEELKDMFVLKFMMDAHRPVAEAEIDRYLNEIDDELFAQALSDTRRRYG